MKVIAIVFADLDVSPLGTRSRLIRPLVGEAVIRRTMRRVLEARGLAGVHCVVPCEQVGATRDLLAGLRAQVESFDAPPPPWRRYVASSRRWSADGWRGGIGGTTMFDECLHPRVAEALARRESADAAALIPAEAALIDPALLDRMLAHYEKVHQDVRLTFTQSAPGLTACIYSTALLAELAKAGQYIGRVMAYRPSDPQREMNIQPCFYPVENVIAHAAARCLTDTTRGFETLSEILTELGEHANAVTISAWLAGRRLHVPDVPDEIEIELTTQDPLPRTSLRPRGAHVPPRGPLSEGLFTGLIRHLAGRDDVRLVLGGFGDPLLHPEWPRFLELARQSGIAAVAIRTPGVYLDGRAAELIVNAGVDVVNVLLDAHTPQTYAAVHGIDCFAQVVSQVEGLLQLARRPEQCGVPLVACEMIKTRRTMPELEAFYDHWLSRGCGAVIAGPSHYSGRWPDLAVMDMSPPTRSPCQRLFRRCMVLADGTVSLCDQDFTGAHALGRLGTTPFPEIWTDAGFGAARAAHQSGNWNSVAPCAACSEWHRP